MCLQNIFSEVQGPFPILLYFPQWVVCVPDHAPQMCLNFWFVFSYTFVFLPQVYVLKRPHVDEFLKRMGELFECVLFTASLSKVSLLFLFSVTHWSHVTHYKEVGSWQIDTITLDTCWRITGSLVPCPCLRLQPKTSPSHIQLYLWYLSHFDLSHLLLCSP